MNGSPDCLFFGFPFRRRSFGRVFLGICPRCHRPLQIGAQFDPVDGVCRRSDSGPSVLLDLLPGAWSRVLRMASLPPGADRHENIFPRAWSKCQVNTAKIWRLTATNVEITWSHSKHYLTAFPRIFEEQGSTTIHFLLIFIFSARFESYHLNPSGSPRSPFQTPPNFFPVCVRGVGMGIKCAEKAVQVIRHRLPPCMSRRGLELVLPTQGAAQPDRRQFLLPLFSLFDLGLPGFCVRHVLTLLTGSNARR